LFGGINQVSEEFRLILAKAVSKLPEDIAEWAAENLLFISSSEEYWAFSLSKDEWNNKIGFVFLSEGLKGEPEDKQAFTIAHEIAHHKLKHRSPIFSRLSQEETEMQERTADKLAEKWLGTVAKS
jgi:Zn-dependent peptidase ImmA (M78 family)